MQHLPRSLTVLRNRNITTLWLSQVFSAFGDRFHEIAIVWYSIQLIGSEAGFILAGGSIARLALGLFGGVFADRWERHRTLVVVDILRGVAVATLPLAAIFGQITLLHLAAVALVVGGLSALFEPALQASLPGLAGDSQNLQAANALMDVTSRLARVFAPGLAGLVILWIPLEQFFSIDALTFFVSALAIAALAAAFPRQPAAPAGQSYAPRQIFTEIWGALRLVYANAPVFWGLIGMTVMSLAWSAAFTVGAALYAEQVLHANVGAYGLIVAAYGVGNVISNLVVGSLEVRNRARFLFIGKIIVGLGFLILSAVSSLPAAMACMAFAATGGPMGDIMILLMIQEDFPADQIGKVYSARMTLSSAGAALGLTLAGPLFKLLDVHTGIAFCAALMLITGVAGTIAFFHTRQPALAQG